MRTSGRRRGPRASPSADDLIIIVVIITCAPHRACRSRRLYTYQRTLVEGTVCIFLRVQLSSSSAPVTISRCRNNNPGDHLAGSHGVYATRVRDRSTPPRRQGHVRHRREGARRRRAARDGRRRPVRPSASRLGRCRSSQPAPRRSSQPGPPPMAAPFDAPPRGGRRPVGPGPRILGS